MGFLSGSACKEPVEMQEMWVPSLGQEDPLEEGVATHSRILARKIPWTEEPGGLQSWGHKELATTKHTHTHTHTQTHTHTLS